jgi:hypothetical protein
MSERYSNAWTVKTWIDNVEHLYTEKMDLFRSSGARGWSELAEGDVRELWTRGCNAGCVLYADDGGDDFAAFAEDLQAEYRDSPDFPGSDEPDDAEPTPCAFKLDAVHGAWYCAVHQEVIGADSESGEVLDAREIKHILKHHPDACPECGATLHPCCDANREAVAGLMASLGL